MVDCQVGSVQPERRFPSVKVWSYRLFDQFRKGKVGCFRWRGRPFWWNFLKHPIVDLGTIFSDVKKVSGYLRAFRNIQRLHTRSRVEKNHVELSVLEKLSPAAAVPRRR